MRYLKQNTATRVTVGPFLDVTDAKTPEVALTATNEHVTFIVDDGGVPTLVIDTTATASGGNNDMVHVTNDNAGYYDLELTAAQTNYVGRAVLGVNYVTDHLPVFHEFMILPANVYDAWMGTDKLQVDAVEVNSSTTAASNLGVSAGTMVQGTIDTTAVATTTTTFESDDVTDSQADLYVGRLICFTSGTLDNLYCRITDYAVNGGRGAFTVTTLPTAPSNNDTFLIV